MSDLSLLQNQSQSLTWMKSEKNFYIGGEWVGVSGLSYHEVINPATEEVIGAVPLANGPIVDQAVKAARQAFKTPSPQGWGSVTRRERAQRLGRVAQLIRAHRAELAAIETLTNGKTYRESFDEDLPECADVFDYYAGWTDKFYGASIPVDPPFINYTVHEPLGVVALIVPWNFPLALASWKLAPALAMGNTVVIKPAANTSHSLIRLFELIHQAQILPRGVINLVYGDEEAGEALSRHPDINKISFTGSTGVGRRIVRGAADSNLKQITLELGGKSPNILFADAEPLDQVIERSFTAMFSHKGEKCSEPTRLLVQESIYDQVVAKMATMAAKVRLGDPFKPETDQGPQANRQHFHKILDYIDQGQRQGARLLAGGTKDLAAMGGRGFYIRPTIFGEVKNSMSIAAEEIFGPVLCVLRFKTEAEAVEIANETPYGLAAGLYSRDASRCQRVARQLDAGMVFINHYGCYDFASPFGGFKQSGWGKEMALQSLEAYTKTKSIWMKYEEA